MRRIPENILWGEDIIGNVGPSPAFPVVLCPRCGSNLYNVYNIQTDWKFLCMKEMMLVDPEKPGDTLQVEVE